MKNRIPKLTRRECGACLHNHINACQVMRKLLAELTGVDPAPERIQVYRNKIPCTRWFDRMHLKCGKCDFASCNETGRPITCAHPVPKWAAKIVKFNTLHRPITQELADKCTQFRKRKTNARTTKSKRQ